MVSHTRGPKGLCVGKCQICLFILYTQHLAQSQTHNGLLIILLDEKVQSDRALTPKGAPLFSVLHWLLCSSSFEQKSFLKAELRFNNIFHAPSFIKGETEAQKGRGTCPKAESSAVQSVSFHRCRLSPPPC